MKNNGEGMIIGLEEIYAFNLRVKFPKKRINVSLIVNFKIYDDLIYGLKSS